MVIDILLYVIVLGIGVGLGFEAREWILKRRRRQAEASSSSTLGVSVEVDCRACGKFNRVPSHRLRDRPKCGQCKVRLMPGKGVVICRVSPMSGQLSSDLYTSWKDDEQLWQCLADHVALQGKALAEARGEQPRVVN
jgi:hypothetical protein